MATPTMPLLVFYLFAVAAAQAPAPATPDTAPAPAAAEPAGSINVTAILEKAGGFSTFINMLKSTQTMNQVQIQLASNSQGITILAPSDAAFSQLKPGTMNSLTDQEKMQLFQYHVLPQYYSMEQFQTASNPVHTMAGGSTGPFGVNVTAFGNSVNVSTGVVSTPIDNAVYSKKPVAVYQVDKVLLPNEIFGPKPPAEAPAPDAGAPLAVPSLSPSKSSDKSASDNGAVLSVGGRALAVVWAVVGGVFFAVWGW